MTSKMIIFGCLLALSVLQCTNNNPTGPLNSALGIYPDEDFQPRDEGSPRKSTEQTEHVRRKREEEEEEERRIVRSYL